jgi:choloylglycine hydrolase
MIYRIISLLLLLCPDIIACTGIRLRALNNNIVYGRTLEFADDLKSEILFIPQNYTITATGPTGKSDGLKWKTKYAAVGTNALNITQLIDGINEAGLAGGLFYFPDYAEYQKISPQEAHKSLASWELLTWILTNFAYTHEVKKALPTIKVSNVPLAHYKAIQPLHVIVHDAHGNSIVIEYISGKLHIHDNVLGVLTNSPSFDWHITNLRNYVNLSALNVPKVKLDTLSIAPLGQGSGLLGLPGDFTPPSRFIRAAVFTQAIEPTRTEKEAVHAAFHVLDLFNIPKGVVRSSRDRDMSDYTQWTSVYDLHNRIFYLHTYDNRQLQMIELKKLAQQKNVKTISMHNVQQVINKTRELLK